MIRVAVVVCLGLLAGVDCVSQTCDVGEVEDVVAGGLCNGGTRLPGQVSPPLNETKCKEYCSKRFGLELAGSQCSDPRPNGKRECICKLKCCNSGCWGDPHCWTCDGAKFGYQGMKRHIMLKRRFDYNSSLPYFEITQQNKKYQNGPMAIIDYSEVAIDTFGLIQLKTPGENVKEYKLLVNGKPQSIPYRVTTLDDYRDKYLHIYYEDPAKTVVVLQTHFGLRIIYSTHVWNNIMYSDIAVDIPKHPDLKDNLHGLLGRWNGNPNDDAIDSKGRKQNLDDHFSWDYGDSWIVPGQGAETAECDRMDAIEASEKSNQNLDPAMKASAEKLCRENLENPQFVECAQKLGRPVPSVQDCITDLSYLKDECTQTEYVHGMVKSLGITCENPNLTVRDLKRPVCPPNTVPLYRLYASRTNDHFYTTSYDEVQDSTKKYGFVSVGITGWVSIDGKDCKCNDTGFQPAYRLFKSGGAKEDHFITMSDKEAADTAAKYGYRREGIAFYCSSAQDQCGAIVPLHRFFNGANHFYSTDIQEGKKLGFNLEGPLCYIWPSPVAVRQ